MYFEVYITYIVCMLLIHVYKYCCTLRYNSSSQGLPAGIKNAYDTYIYIYTSYTIDYQ